MTLPVWLTKDFFLGIVFSATTATLYQLYRLFQEPSIEEMEARACAPMAKMSRNDNNNNSNANDTTAAAGITLFGFNAKGGHDAADRGVLDASPYVMYVELCCRMMGQAYTKVAAIPADSRFRPRHKLPVAIIHFGRRRRDGDDDGAVVLDDSRKIVQEIQKQQQQIDTRMDSNATTKAALSDAHLDDDQRAMARLVENTLCQSLFWSLLYNKFDTHRGRDDFRRQLVDHNVPTAPLRRLISAMAFRQMHAQLVGQGIARYPRAEVLDKARQDLAALSCILGSKHFILDKNRNGIHSNGEREESSSPTFTDAMLYAMLVLVLEDEELQVDLCSAAKVAHPNLVAFVDRMRMRYIPECC
jgi:hypothetical protein